MVRTISRPFGRPANTASTSSMPQLTSSSASMPSATDYVLQDTADDTPHDIHPHAASYASQRGAAPAAPARQTKTMRQMTHAERLAWAQLNNVSSAYAPAPAPAPTTSAPSAQDNTASTGSHAEPDLEQAYRYGNQAEAWAPHNEHLRLQYQPWGQTAGPQADEPTPPVTPSTAQPAPQVQPEPEPEQEFQFFDPTTTTSSASTSGPAPALASPVVLARPARTSSLVPGPAARTLAVVTGASGSGAAAGTPELEIVIGRGNGQDITIRLFAPPTA